MRMLHSSYSVYYPSFSNTARVSDDSVTMKEALRIYFTILFGVAVFALVFYYLYPQMPH